jgi:hypothetical protein
MSDVSIVILGVLCVLSGVAIVAWLARPSEFRPVRFAAPERHPRYISVAPRRVPKVFREPHQEDRVASPRTITRGVSEQGSFWAKPPTHAATSIGETEPRQDSLEGGLSDPRL